jgi:hypothetical protein
VERHVTLLRILVGLWGGLAMLVGLSWLLLAAGAFAEFQSSLGTGLEFAAGLTTFMFGAVGMFAVLWGGAHVWAAALLSRRRPLGRVLTLALALVNLLVLPFGTALGVYALWILLPDQGRRLFEPAR